MWLIKRQAHEGVNFVSTAVSDICLEDFAKFKQSQLQISSVDNFLLGYIPYCFLRILKPSLCEMLGCSPTTSAVTEIAPLETSAALRFTKKVCVLHISEKSPCFIKRL